MIKKIVKSLLARKYMHHYTIVKMDGSKCILSRKYAIKDLLSYDCYSREMLEKLSLPDLLYEYIAVSSGGTSVYNRNTGKEEYVGYAS